MDLRGACVSEAYRVAIDIVTESSIGRYADLLKIITGISRASGAAAKQVAPAGMLTHGRHEHVL